MLVNKNISKEIIDDAGITRTIRAERYLNEGKVSIIKTDYKNEDNFTVTSIVSGINDDYEVNIEVEKGELKVASCECRDYQNFYGACKHIVATLMKFEQTRYWDSEAKDGEKNISKNIRHKYRSFNNLVNNFYNAELQEMNKEEKIQLTEEEKIKIEARMDYDKFLHCIKLDFKIGNSRMYKIKDLTEFYTRVINEEFFKYGEKLQFVHSRDNFDNKSKELLDFILRYAEVMKYTNSENRYGYYQGTNINKSVITLGENTLDEAFELLKDEKVMYNYEYENLKMEFLDENPKIEFNLDKVNREELLLKSNIDIFKIAILKGKKYDYILEQNKLYRCNEEFSNSILKMIKAFRECYTSEMLLSKENLKEFYSVVMPKIENSIKIHGIDEAELEKYKPQKLGVKVFLDFDENNYLIADVKFCYADEEFNPLEENVKIKALRNELEENRCLNILKRTGFMLDVNNLRFIIPNDEQIYEFLSNDINLYMQKFEVLATDNFKTKEIKEPKLGAIGVKVENDLLNIDLGKLSITPQEVQEVMESYKIKKKFHRLKDGSFFNLSENKDVQFFEQLTTGMGIDIKEIKDNKIKLPINRTLYLNELLNKFKDTKVTKNSEYKQIIENLEKDNFDEKLKIPKNMQKILRDYQKIGFSWLKTLDYYKFGGILADDMGLGKTIQILAVIISYVEENKENRKTSIVVSPSSLALNWKKEAERFAPKLKVKVISGNITERRKIIENLQKYDVIITSYDLLKRDIGFYIDTNYEFKYIIADEAQYLKNSNTQNAKAIKELKAETRYALTGTPIENSLAELWSIFDFVMPGYLFQYKKFKNMYEVPIVKDEDNETMNKLKMLIQPFILRRNKKEVLTELPEKTITILNNDMDEEQQKIYMSYLVKARKDISEKININGFEKSQIMILAALTRLRQICCHPSLFLEDYNGESSKLIQCMEIIDEAIKAGHKILLFSGYTSMFEIIQEELEKREIQYFKLTGSTKVDERIKLVDDFNTNPNIKVFLISLKAGGTGLNLTGADMVIHYDPWWNVSSENQATDRAYRIGQKNNVQVYKLITNNSIEEKIYELQQRKSKLMDNMLSTKTSFISQFSKDEIMQLFEI